MKMFVVVEGPNDEAFLVAMIPRLLPTSVQPLELVTKRMSELFVLPPHSSTPEHVLQRKAMAAVFAADLNECDALIFVHDVDQGGLLDGPTLNSKAAHADVVSHIITGARQAQKPVKVAVGAPCRMIEAWVLADLRALAGLNSGSVDSLSWFASSRTPQPQDMLKIAVDICLGRKRKSSDYGTVGEQADLAVLGTRSPISFVHFQQQVESLA